MKLNVNYLQSHISIALFFAVITFLFFNPILESKSPQEELYLSDIMSMAPLWATSLCAYSLFFLLTKSTWAALLGAVAYAFSSYNMLIFYAGQIDKTWAIACIPLVLSGFLLITQKKYLTGGLLYALSSGFEWMSGHIQITYYLAVFIFILFVSYAVYCIFKKEIKILLSASLTLFIALLLGILPGVIALQTGFETNENSLWHFCETTIIHKNNSATPDIPDKEEVFVGGYGKDETFSLIIPNIKGGASQSVLGQNSNLFKEFKLNGQRTGKEITTYTYWGDQSSTHGPAYFGAGICFLFVLGMFIIKNKMKWGLFFAAVFFILLSWGKNLRGFNDFFSDNLPVYNHFLTPSLALLIPSMIFPLIGIWGLKTLYHHRNVVEKKRLKKQFLFSWGITGMICLVFWLSSGLFYDFRSSNDARFISQFPDWYYNALLADRKSLLRIDAFRSFIFIFFSGGCLFFFINKKKKQLKYSFIILALLLLLDLWTVNKRYLSSCQETVPTADSGQIYLK
jgi:hypothetical protein